MASKKQVLMVEGRDDEHVVKHICGERNLGRIDNIHKYDGKDPLIESIGVRLKESGITTLGIILDADTDVQARWQSVVSRLNDAGYIEVPTSPAPDGTVINAPANSLLPRVGVWLMPDNKVPGILEDFLRFFVADDDPLLAHVDESMMKIPSDQIKFNGFRRPKARIHTLLAWQEEPGKPFGQAISARYLDPHLPGVQTFADWLSRTFFL